MTSTTTAASALLRRDQAGGCLFGQTMGLVAVTAGVFALSAYSGRDLSGGWAICWFLVFSHEPGSWPVASTGATGPRYGESQYVFTPHRHNNGTRMSSLARGVSASALGTLAIGGGRVSRNR